MWRILAGLIVAVIVVLKVAASGPAVDRFRAALDRPHTTVGMALHCGFGKLRPEQRRACRG